MGETGAETLRRTTDAVAGSQRQIAEEAAGRLQEASRTVAETARGTAEDIRALAAEKPLEPINIETSRESVPVKS